MATNQVEEEEVERLERERRRELSRVGRVHSFFIALLKAGGARLPRHVAFVMDGNRRFARRRQWRVERGHSLGFEALLNCLEVCLELGVETVTVYAFSRDNFSRPAEEVEVLMNLAREKFLSFLDNESLVMRHGVVVRMLGDVGLLPRDVQLAAADVVNKTMNNTGRCRLNVCFAYSGEEEVRSVCDALARAASEGSLTREDITPGLVRRASFLGLYDAEPDIIVRTSGETRLSDFMLLHAGSAHLAFIDVLWPELSFWDLYRVVLDWQRCGSGGGETAEEDLARLSPRALAFLKRRRVEYEEFWRRIGERG